MSPTMSRTLASWGGGKNLGKTLIACAVVYPLFLVSRASFGLYPAAGAYENPRLITSILRT